MKPALALNLFSKVGFGEKANEAGTPGTIGESLFKKFLMKESKAELSKEKRAAIPDKITQGRTGKDRERLENTLSIPDFLMHGMKLEPGFKGKLEEYLGKLGLTSGESAAAIEAATDKNGFVQLDRLTARLASFKGVNAKKQMDLFIAASDVPQFQKVLFNMGLSAGEVKALVEKGNDGEGNLPLGKIMPDLSRRFPEIDSKEALARLLSHSDIQLKSREIIPSIERSKLKTLLKEYAATPSEDVQKDIKVRLADLLREKGVPPQRVKSFLEGMSVEYAEEASRTDSANGEKSAKAAKISLWDGIALNPQHPVKKDTWTEKILAILKGIGIGIGKGDQGKDRSSGPVLSSWVEKESGGPKPLAERVISIVGSEGTTPSGKSLLGTLESTKGDDRQTLVTGHSLPGPSDQNATVDKLAHSGEGTGNFGRLMNSSQETSNLSSLLDRMQWMVEAGRQKARIQLSPPELGQIDLRLVIDHGHLHAHLGTENPMVKQMIESHLDQLKQHLTDLGFVVEEFSVDVGQDQREFGGNLWERGDAMEGARWNGKPSIQPVLEQSTTLRALTDDRYQINVRV